MDEPLSKAGLIALIRRERAVWDSLLAEIGEGRMTRPGVAGDWTFKDVAAHLAEWRFRAVEQLQAAARGEAPPPRPWAGVPGASEDSERANVWIYTTHRARPLDDVLRGTRDSLDQLEAAVAALSEPDLTGADRFPWMGGTPLAAMVVEHSADHFFNGHEPGIRAWLAATPA